jgi:two-component system sensor histidine kinase BaeS
VRRRLTIAIVALVAVTIVVTGLGGYYFIRRAAIATAEQQLNRQGQAVTQTISGTLDAGARPNGAVFKRELRIIRSAGGFTGIRRITVSPDGAITGDLPPGLTANQLDPDQLLGGHQTSGQLSPLEVFTASPIPLVRSTGSTQAIVITQSVHSPANGLRYFLLVGAVALVVAAAMALLLTRRFTRPLAVAADTARRIADGDLEAAMPATPRGYPEFAQLVAAVNAMGTNLARARNQERQFLLSVSHELRTPLTSIRGYADAVVDGAAADPVGAAGVISSEAQRLERLVQDLLDLARLDAHRFSLHLQTVDGIDVAHQVVEGFQPRAQHLDLVLDVVLPSPVAPLWVRADADRLGQIVANLVDNAASFARHRVVIGAGRAADSPGSGPGRPVIWVTDDGPGIPADELAKVFDRHYISDRVQGRRRGTGLGLAIVAELAGAMGATVRAESPVTDGRGTRMVVWLASPDPADPPAMTQGLQPASGRD